MGICLALVARARGVPNIEVSDLSRPRLETAQHVGFNAKQTGLDGEYDVVFDTVGAAETRGQSLALLRPGGVAVWVGLHSKGAALDAQAMIRAEQRVLTTFCYDRQDFQVATDLVSQLKPDWLDVQPLSTGDRVFRDLCSTPGRFPKTMLVP
jgi:threonine dehydrogenase-like Zn-dependent dehydrogenase